MEDRSDRHPETPEQPLDLRAAANELLEEARGNDAGRAARNLIPGPGAPLSQTLLALRRDATLSDHVANGPATLQVLEGAVTFSGASTTSVGTGAWATVPREKHGLTADEDSVVLLTVAPVPGH